MTNISVLFEVPAEIVKGLADGTLERIGGVVRRVGDKKIVVWLTEAGEYLSKESKIPNVLTSPQVLMGMQVANLAVNIAGFAIIYHKLKQVEHQLNSFDCKLERLAGDQQWLDKKQLISHLSPIVVAMNTLENIHRISDKSIAKDKLIAADNRLGEEVGYFRQILGNMLVEELEQERPIEFATCYRAWVMASQGHIQTMAELGENTQAIARAEEFKLNHQKFGIDFLEARRDPLRKLSNDRAKSHAEQLLVQLGKQCAGAHEIIKGKVLQLKYMKENGLEVQDLPSLEAQKNIGYALLYFN